MTALQLEPSAQAPWTSTMFGLVSLLMWTPSWAAAPPGAGTGSSGSLFFEDPGVKRGREHRCFPCKAALFAALGAVSLSREAASVVEGSPDGRVRL